ncbi:hypothetical protein [Ferrovum myxofaciens]|uniref:hypothetical protein n=1 Tax=Ferrovum myxofaciens TaxID=416213 RepID=UPI002355E88D|nr:hypothetical protein [Ferrovum myxofaciens]MBU6994276.1 hypothetical protein [Ferrovum myxofaciens]
MINRKIVYWWYIPSSLVGGLLLCFLAITQESKSIAVEFLSLVLLGVISIEAWLYAQKAHIEDVRFQFLSLLTDNCAKISAACTEIFCMYPAFSESEKHASKSLTMVFPFQTGVMYILLLSSMLRQVSKLHEAKFKLDQSIRLGEFEANNNISELNNAIGKMMTNMDESIKRVRFFQNSSGYRQSDQDLMQNCISEIKKLLPAVEKDLKSGKLDKFLGLG